MSSNERRQAGFALRHLQAVGADRGGAWCSPIFEHLCGNPIHDIEFDGV